MASDISVLKSIWFKKLDGESHADRLDNFYKNQAEAYDRFRKNFLHGREALMAALASRLEDGSDMIWVDLGGGTAENVDMMSKYMPLNQFKKIYVVDLCSSLCKVANKKVALKGWKNVEIVEADACKFQLPEGKAALVTFSYSLSMIPPFHSAVDNAMTMLDDNGLIGVTDFYVSSKYDMPARQISTIRRWFWRCTFDSDNIDIGPERRNYLDHKATRVFEYNGAGGIPYVPFLRAPYYIWIGTKRQDDEYAVAEKKKKPHLLFPPTFLYSMSWEDPKADENVLRINSSDKVYTLTGGGCNAFEYILQGAKEVVSIDCNPAQSYLLELKTEAVRRLEYEDLWLLFGNGVHRNRDEIFHKQLAPYLSQGARDFWAKHLYYFKDGFYYHGGMGKLSYYAGILFRIFGLKATVAKLCSANTLEEQKKIWNSILLVKMFKNDVMGFHTIIKTFLSLTFLNQFVMWFGGGVPRRQLSLIRKDNVHIFDYVMRTFDGVACNSLLSRDNYFYKACLTGSFSKDCCPAYLRRENYESLREGVLDRLKIKTGFFEEELKKDKYSKVILMDHVDWLDAKQSQSLAKTLWEQVLPGGRVIWRSAGSEPPYVDHIRKAGFMVQQVQKHDYHAAEATYLDRVNMYASYWVASKP